jgi:hypothetical protein
MNDGRFCRLSAFAIFILGVILCLCIADAGVQNSSGHVQRPTVGDRT